ncbi:TolB family protein [Paenibacillus sp. 2TAB23]|uniref:TolB family protein n=1 Tax=Paenibacillus sp. 2TAB23 TaxID=3233004 RepID=UPI003F9C39A8
MMKKTKMAIMGLAAALLVFTAACSSEDNNSKVIIKEPGETITVIDNAGKETGEPDVSVEKVEAYENVAFTDWIDEETVVVSKENTSLDKMKLEELADSYPKSLYLYNLNTKQYELLKEQDNVFLGEATLSSDRKHLLYQQFDLGDPVYYVLNLDTLESFGITGGSIGGAVSAKWADEKTIIGAAYSGGAYTASTSGSIAPLAGLNEEALYIVEKIKDKVYYNTQSDESLMVMNLSTKEKTNLGIDHVYRVVSSPDGNQLLILQTNGTKSKLILSDADGKNQKTIAEGTELGGVSWSLDQRMIAYSEKADVNGTTIKGLYVYDMLTGKSTSLAVDVDNAVTAWSPSGKALLYTEWDGKQTNSHIVHLKYSIQK